MPFALQDFGETMDCVVGRAFIGAPVPGIERYDVDVRGYASQQIYKLQGMRVGAVVDTLQQYIFKGDPCSPVYSAIAAAIRTVGKYSE